MNSSFEKRLEALEQSAGFAPKTHILWDRGRSRIKKEIAAMIKGGRAQADDRFITVSWSRGPERPMNPDSFHDWPSRDAVPPADNDP